MFNETDLLLDKMIAIHNRGILQEWELDWFRDGVARVDAMTVKEYKGFCYVVHIATLANFGERDIRNVLCKHDIDCGRKPFTYNF